MQSIIPDAPAGALSEHPEPHRGGRVGRDSRSASAAPPEIRDVTAGAPMSIGAPRETGRRDSEPPLWRRETSPSRDPAGLASSPLRYARSLRGRARRRQARGSDSRALRLNLD